jgi:hypothetical protein
MKKSGCVNCKYVSEERDYLHWLTCKKNPPTAIRSTGSTNRGIWPKVADEEWCWEWEGKEFSEEDDEREEQ